MDLSPVDIPELDERVIHQKSALDPGLRQHAKKILAAKGRLRLAPHPFLFKHKARLCLTDRWHQLLGKKSHKRATCQQHLTCLLRTLNHDRTSFMEAFNARQRKRLRTICTADPSHVIPFYHKFMYWENRKIIQRQEALLEKCRRPGEVVGEDEVFRFAIMVCECCRKPGHTSGSCPGAGSVGGGGGGEAPLNDSVAAGSVEEAEEAVAAERVATAVGVEGLASPREFAGRVNIDSTGASCAINVDVANSAREGNQSGPEESNHQSSVQARPACYDGPVASTAPAAVVYTRLETDVDMVEEAELRRLEGGMPPQVDSGGSVAAAEEAAAAAPQASSLGAVNHSGRHNAMRRHAAPVGALSKTQLWEKVTDTFATDVSSVDSNSNMAVPMLSRLTCSAWLRVWLLLGEPLLGGSLPFRGRVACCTWCHRTAQQLDPRDSEEERR
jgi:hypothetical protein